MAENDDDKGDPVPSGWPAPPTAAGGAPGYPAYGAPGAASEPRRSYGCGALIAAAIGGAVFGAVALIGVALLFDDELSIDLIVGRHDVVGEGDGVRVGDCLEGDPGDVDVTSRDGVVDCDRDHGSEVMAVVTLPDLESPPSDGRMRDFVTEACALVFRDTRGEDYFTSDLEIGALPPSDAAWDDGDRSVFCLLDP